jgi:hypothetical protein
LVTMYDAMKARFPTRREVSNDRVNWGQ